MPGMTGQKATGTAAISAVCCCLLCCAIPGVVAMIVLNKTFGDWPTVDAIVVGLEMCPNRGGSSSSSSTSTSMQDNAYAITYNFTTLDGQRITTDTEYCSHPVPDIGETHQITYDPDDPFFVLEEDILDTGFIAAKSAAGVGWFCVAIGICIAVFVLNKPKPNDTTQPSNGYPATTTYGEQPNGPAGDYPTGQQQPVAFHTNDPAASATPVAYSEPYGQPTGPAGDFASALDGPPKASGGYNSPGTYDSSGQPVAAYGGNAPAQPAQVYGGPATYYK